MTPVTEVEQLKQQNALLLRRLLAVSRERDALAKQVAALRVRGADERCEADGGDDVKALPHHVHWRDLTPEEQREVRRIATEMSQFPFEPHTFVERNGQGSTREVVPGAPGVPVYWDIVGRDPKSGRPNFRYTRREVARRLQRFLDGGPRSRVSDRAVIVARRRLAGDRTVARPLLPLEGLTEMIGADTLDLCTVLAKYFNTTTVGDTIHTAVEFTHFWYSLATVDEEYPAPSVEDAGHADPDAFAAWERQIGRDDQAADRPDQTEGDAMTHLLPRCLVITARRCPRQAGKPSGESYVCNHHARLITMALIDDAYSVKTRRMLAFERWETVAEAHALIDWMHRRRRT